MASHTASIQWLSSEYYAQNGDYFEVLENPPSALEFSRLVHVSRPVLIKGFRIPASKLWSNEYLINRMGSRNMTIAVTPNGLADAITRGADDQLYFVEPHLEKMTMEEFLFDISSGSSSGSSDVRYLQSQNGNLYRSSDFEGGEGSVSEFQLLRRDVPSDISWCTKALGKPPDAVNLWIGDNRSITSIHSDPYENIYTVVRGAKHFTLLPPTEGWCLDERTYPHATYTRCPSTSRLTLVPSSGTNEIRWSSVSEPHIPGVLPRGAHPIHITLHAGDTLYLPAGWWHHVRQSGGTTIAVNWWYDTEMRGMSWVTLSFLRGIGEAPRGNGDGEGDDKGAQMRP